ncbi:MAG: hypothetical protein V1837_02655 [Candidatus Woesearchaeota archaeon]
MQDLFSDFVGHQVKVPYKDGNQIKVARGRLEVINDGFVRIAGDLGTIIINTKNIEKMSRISDGSRFR